MSKKKKTTKAWTLAVSIRNNYHLDLSYVFRTKKAAQKMVNAQHELSTPKYFVIPITITY